jgi:hypothetical protein
MRAFVRYDNQGIIVPTSFVMKKTMPKVGQWKEISTSKSVSGFPAQSSQKNLRAFVRYNGKNKVVPGSVVVRGQVPAGNFSEVTYDLSRPLVPEPTTTTTSTIPPTTTTTSTTDVPAGIKFVDRPPDSTTGLISTISNDTPNSNGKFVVLADFFQVTEEVTLDTFVNLGFYSNNSSSFIGSGVSIFIYTDAGGMPSSNPTVPSGSILSLENISVGSGLSWQHITSTINERIEFTIDITEANGNVPVTLPIGNYWLCFGQNTSGAPAASGRWNWLGSSDTTLYQTMLIDPQNSFGAGATNWVTVTSLIGQNFPTCGWTLTKSVPTTTTTTTL